MDLGEIATAAPYLAAIITAVATVIGLSRGTDRRRNRIKVDAEIARALPDESEARARMLAHLENQVDQLIEDETERTRDWSTLALTLIMLPGMAGLTIWLAQKGEWWSYCLAAVTGFMVLVFLYGVYDTGTKAKRDAKGNRIER